MITKSQMLDLKMIQHFVFAGKSTFTLVSKVTGTRLTYRVASAMPNKNVSYVRVRTSSDHWQFLGIIDDDCRYKHATRKSRITSDAPSARAIHWFISHLRIGILPDSIEFWHEGKCGKCGRKLTVPESIQLGLGPQCRRNNDSTNPSTIAGAQCRHTPKEDHRLST